MAHRSWRKVRGERVFGAGQELTTSGTLSGELSKGPKRIGRTQGEI